MTKHQKVSFRGLFGEKQPSESESWLDLAQAQIDAARALSHRGDANREACELMRGAVRSVSRAILATPTEPVGVPK